METELGVFTKICICVFVSICYSYSVGRMVPKGITRLFCLLPVVLLLLYLPLNLSTVNLSGLTSFLVGWLVNFKILLFASGKGPLSSEPSISLGLFIALALLPINGKQNPSPKHGEQLDVGERTVVNYAVIKVMIFAVLLRFRHYIDYIHPKMVFLVQFFVIYLQLDILLVTLAILARLLTGVGTGPLLNKPYVSSSLQDFWGKRWNLMVSRILRTSVYEPIRNLNLPFMGRNPAVLGTFLVSGLMHEYMLYCLTRERPTWEITFFFVLHGLCVAVEISVKKTVGGGWRLPWLISWPLSSGFVTASAYWLLSPSLNRSRAFEWGLEEGEALLLFAENAIQRFRVS